MKDVISRFKAGEAWVVFRIDSFMEGQLVHVYTMMDVYGTYIFDHIMTPEESPEPSKISGLMRIAFNAKKRWPKKIFFPEHDPAEEVFRNYAEKNKIPFEVTSLKDFNSIIGPFKKLFGQQFPVIN